MAPRSRFGFPSFIRDLRPARGARQRLFRALSSNGDASSAGPRLAIAVTACSQSLPGAPITASWNARYRPWRSATMAARAAKRETGSGTGTSFHTMLSPAFPVSSSFTGPRDRLQKPRRQSKNATSVTSPSGLPEAGDIGCALSAWRFSASAASASALFVLALRAERDQRLLDHFRVLERVLADDPPGSFPSPLPETPRFAPRHRRRSRPRQGSPPARTVQSASCTRARPCATAGALAPGATCRSARKAGGLHVARLPPRHASARPSFSAPRRFAAPAIARQA